MNNQLLTLFKAIIHKYESEKSECLYHIDNYFSKQDNNENIISNIDYYLQKFVQADSKAKILTERFSSYFNITTPVQNNTPTETQAE